MRALFRGLFDDAALFPPGNAPMDEAIPAHLAHHTAWYADLVGPFVCPADRLADLASLPGPVTVSVILAEGTLGAALPHLTIAAVEIPAGRYAVAATLPPDLPVYLEAPWDATQAEALGTVAGLRADAKLRTGGTTAGAFPTEAQLATAIAGCLAHGLAFKCTAGLHHAVRHTAPGTGFEHHGFLNVLIATAALLDGAGTTQATRVLAERSPETLTAAARRLDDAQISRLRASFRSFGTCSITEPLDDLTALGLLDPADRTETR